MFVGGDSLSNDERADTRFSAALSSLLIRSSRFEVTSTTLSASVLTAWATGHRKLSVFNFALGILTTFRDDDTISSSVRRRQISKSTDSSFSNTVFSATAFRIAAIRLLPYDPQFSALVNIIAVKAFPMRYGMPAIASLRLAALTIT